MSYTWTDGDLITAERLNNTNGYDLILSVPIYDLSYDTVEVIHGDILECEQKVADGENVNAILLLTSEWSYTPSTANIPQILFVAKLTHWVGGYCWMTFSCMYSTTTSNNAPIEVVCYNITYDPDDGSILSINNPYKVIS